MRAPDRPEPKSEPEDAGLPWALRVEVWDRALAAVRATLRGAGMREVSTPVRVEAVAIEPWIEPLESAGAWLATSPELAMKRMLTRDVGSIFQIAHVFRRAERGALHSEEFHLIEWYRDQRDEAAGASMVAAIADVEAQVAAVFEAVGGLLAPRPRPAPRRWRRVCLTELMSETLGLELAGDEDAGTLGPALARVRAAAGVHWDSRVGVPRDPALADLLAWTELFSLWSDLHLDPWLEELGPEVGVHVDGFPAALAALAALEPGGRRALRFETHVAGVELANGYVELRDPVEQRRRFELVAAMRAHHEQGPLPTPAAFLAELGRLPPCVGVALGLDRLIALACGRRRLDDVALVL